MRDGEFVRRLSTRGDGDVRIGVLGRSLALGHRVNKQLAPLVRELPPQAWRRRRPALWGAFFIITDLERPDHVPLQAAARARIAHAQGGARESRVGGPRV